MHCVLPYNNDIEYLDCYIFPLVDSTQLEYNIKNNYILQVKRL